MQCSRQSGRFAVGRTEADLAALDDEEGLAGGSRAENHAAAPQFQRRQFFGNRAKFFITQVRKERRASQALPDEVAVHLLETRPQGVAELEADERMLVKDVAEVCLAE